ncbi:MAG: hypothetical protein WC389_17360 [Lutibacter sp.]|jgi:hypothetical protein
MEMICEYALHCPVDCPLKESHALNHHPEDYGDCNSECQGDIPGTKAGAKCVPVCVVCKTKPQKWSESVPFKGGMCADCWQSW